VLSVGDEGFEVDDEQNRANDEGRDEVLVNGDATTLQHPAPVKQPQINRWILIYTANQSINNFLAREACSRMHGIIIACIA